MKPHLSHVLNMINDCGLSLKPHRSRKDERGKCAPATATTAQQPCAMIAGLSDRTFSPISARPGDHRAIIFRRPPGAQGYWAW